MLIHDNLLDEPEVLTNLLLNHIVVGFEPICSEDLVCGNLLFMANSSEKGQMTKTACSFSESPPQGDDAKPEDGEEPTAIYQKGDRNGSSKDNMPEIIGPDTRAKNGVIHIINNVILQRIAFLVKMLTMIKHHLLMMIKHQVSEQVVRLVENVRVNVRIMMGVASQKLDGANETVRKGSGTLIPAYVKAVEEMMISNQQNHAVVLLIVTLVRKSVRIMKDVAGNQQQNVRPTVKRSGVVINALVVPIVDHARVNVRITMVVTSLKLDTVNETVRKGLGTLTPAYVEAVEMINQQKYAAVVILVVHASESVKRMKVVAGNQQENARAIVNRSGAHVKFSYVYVNGFYRAIFLKFKMKNYSIRL